MQLLMWFAAATLLAGVPEPDHDPLLADARHARDRADVSGLRACIDAAANNSMKNADSYVRLAALNQWLCEAAQDRSNPKLLKQAAQAGLTAAENAVKLNDQSSEAHRLEGQFLAALIPLTFAGGMRYGPRATRELDRSIELDPQNLNARIARAEAYFYTPGTFGGDRPKAIEQMKRVVESVPASDLAHIRLAQFHLALNQRADAAREIAAAIRLNPDRTLARSVAAQVEASK